MPYDYTVSKEHHLADLMADALRLANEIYAASRVETKTTLPYLIEHDDWMYIIQTLYFIADTQENERCRKLANLLSKLSRSEE